jgi:hypothetical protein
MASFSQRLNYVQPPEISIREDMPIRFRWPLAQLAARRVGSPVLLQIVEGFLDPYGLNPLPGQESSAIIAHFAQNFDEHMSKVRRRLDACDWFRVYDITEGVRAYLVERDQKGIATAPHLPELFERDINTYFIKNGIGWQFVNGQLATRGNEAFENTVTVAAAALEAENKPTAAGHLQFAVSALSARPIANTSGAVTHATSAVECVLSEITTGKKKGLSDHLQENPRLFHQALREGLGKIYAYASDVARHGKEGTTPDRDDAEFVIATCAAVCTLLVRKQRR